MVLGYFLWPISLLVSTTLLLVSAPKGSRLIQCFICALIAFGCFGLFALSVNVTPVLGICLSVALPVALVFVAWRMFLARRKQFENS